MLLDPQETSSLNQLIIQQIGCNNRSRMANLNGNKLVLCSTINRGETIKYDWINNYINNNNNNTWSSSSTSALNKHSNVTNDFDLFKHNHLNHLNHLNQHNHHHQHNAPVYHIFYSTEYSDSIIYIMAVLFIYFLLFSLLIYANWTSFNHNSNNSSSSNNKSNYKNYENECVKKKKRPKQRNNNNSNNRLDYNIVANGYNDIVDVVVDDDDNDDNNVNCNQQTHQYDGELDSKLNFTNGFGNNRQTLIIQMLNDGTDDDQSNQIQITTQRLCLARNIRKFFNHTFKTWLQLLTRNFRNRHLLINDHNSLIVYHKKLPNNELEFI